MAQATIVKTANGKGVPVGYGHTIPEVGGADPKRQQEYEYRPYPRMLTVPAEQGDIDEWRKRNSYFDRATGETGYNGAAPKIGKLVPLRATQDEVDAGFALAIGDPVIVHSLDDEKLVLASRGLIDKPKPAAIATEALPSPETMEADNARLEAAIARRKELLAQTAQINDADAMASQPPAAPRKKPGPKPKQAAASTELASELPPAES